MDYHLGSFERKKEQIDIVKWVSVSEEDRGEKVKLLRGMMRVCPYIFTFVWLLK